jgi:hypothetical protein
LEESRVFWSGTAILLACVVESLIALVVSGGAAGQRGVADPRLTVMLKAVVASGGDHFLRPDVADELTVGVLRCLLTLERSVDRDVLRLGSLSLWVHGNLLPALIRDQISSISPRSAWDISRYILGALRSCSLSLNKGAFETGVLMIV